MGFIDMEPFSVELFGEVFHFDPANVYIMPAETSHAEQISAKEYAERNGVSPTTVRRWLSSGKIEGEKDPYTGLWYVNADAEPPEQVTGRPRGPWQQEPPTERKVMGIPMSEVIEMIRRDREGKTTQEEGHKWEEIESISQVYPRLVANS